MLIFDRSKATEMTEITTEDIRSYTELQNADGFFVTRKVSYRVCEVGTISVKSFMNYRVKDKIVDALEKQGDYRLVEQKPQACCCVESESIATKRSLQQWPPADTPLMRHLAENGMALNCSYGFLHLVHIIRRKSVFDKNKGYSKTLVFSSWGDGSPHDCRTLPHMRRSGLP